MFLDTGQHGSPSPAVRRQPAESTSEAREMVERMYERARRLLDTHRDKLEALAQYLLQPRSHRPGHTGDAAGRPAAESRRPELANS